MCKSNETKPAGVKACMLCSAWMEIHSPGDTSAGECRLTHPREIGVEDGKRIFPVTLDIDWCMEFEAVLEKISDNGKEGA